MADSNTTAAVTTCHANAIQATAGLHFANAGRSKMWTAGILAGMLFLTAGKMQLAVLAWAAGSVVLLALADAYQVALAWRAVQAYNRFMARVPLNGGNAMKAEEFCLPAPELGFRQAGQVLSALASFSVWPFYGALLALLVAFHVQSVPDSGKRMADTGKGMPEAGMKHAAGCSSGGGCGTSGGCGSGGCGASAGKACGCGSAAAKKPAAAPTVAVSAGKAAQPASTGTPGPVPVTQPAIRPAQFPNPGMRTITPNAPSTPNTPNAPGIQPGQALPNPAGRIMQQPPGVRLPVAGAPKPQPPTVAPEKGGPPEGRGAPPEGAAPQVPAENGSPAGPPPAKSP